MKIALLSFLINLIIFAYSIQVYVTDERTKKMHEKIQKLKKLLRFLEKEEDTTLSHDEDSSTTPSAPKITDPIKPLPIAPKDYDRKPIQTIQILIFGNFDYARSDRPPPFSLAYTILIYFHNRISPQRIRLNIRAIFSRPSPCVIRVLKDDLIEEDIQIECELKKYSN